MSSDSSNSNDEKTKSLSSLWNPWLGLAFGILLFLVAQIVAQLLVSLYPVFKGWNADQAISWLQHALVAQLSYLALSLAFIIGGVVMFVKNYARWGTTAIGLKRPKRKDILYAIAAFPVYYVLLVAVVIIVQFLIPAIDVNQAQDLGLNGRYDSLQLVFIFICLAILTPVAEELLFRGLIYSSLKRALPLWGAVVVTSSLFAAGHLAEGGSAGPLYIGAIDTFILSLILIYLREKTGRIWSSIMLHSFKNIVAFVSLFVLHVR